MSRGLLATIGAFLLWGLLPLYWHALGAVPPTQIMAHRMLWCWLLLALYLVLRPAARRGFNGSVRVICTLAITGLLISFNWWLFIWAVNNGHTVETSLGYFINPLVNVVLGVAVLHERLNPRQWLAVGIAALGVAYLTWQLGHLPVIALALALSFSFYGLLRKTVHAEAVHGLAVESTLLLPFAALYLLWLEFHGQGWFGHAPARVNAMLLLSGLVTALPLVWFAYGARRIAYSTVGLIQYLAPSLTLACAILAFGEPFTRSEQIGFAAIWLALAIYAGDSLLRLSRVSSTSRAGTESA